MVYELAIISKGHGSGGEVGDTASVKKRKKEDESKCGEGKLFWWDDKVLYPKCKLD